MGVTPHDEVLRFVTSWVFTPRFLFVIRALLSLYAFTTIFFIFGWYGAHSDYGKIGRSFSYFTWLTYWGLAFYNLVSAVHTWSYWRSGKPLLARWPRALQIGHSIFYSTIVVFPWIVTIVYWTAIYKPGAFKSTFRVWTNISQHTLNSVYALFEIACPRTQPLPWIHLIPITIILSCYLGVAYITNATQGFYTYGFLDVTKHSSKSVAGYIIGVLAAAILVFTIVRYLILLRLWITETKMRKPGKFNNCGKQDYGLIGGGTSVPMHNVNAV